MRIDKWLWVARLAKTRGDAAEAVRGGRVKLGGHATKPAKEVAPGDVVELSTGPVRRTFVVRGLAPRRGPAKEAVLLYEETEDSIARVEAFAAQRRLQAAIPEREGGGRPTKRDRRRFEQLRGRDPLPPPE